MAKFLVIREGPTANKSEPIFATRPRVDRRGRQMRLGAARRRTTGPPPAANWPTDCARAEAGRWGADR